MSDQSFDRDDLVAEIKKELGVRVERSDPILAAGVVNEFMLRRAIDMLRREMKAQSALYIAAIEQAPKSAEKNAAEIITRAGEWAEKRIMAAAEDAALRLDEVQMKAVEKAVVQLQNATKKLDQIAAILRNVSLILGIVVVVGVALWVGVKIGYMLPLPAKH